MQDTNQMLVRIKYIYIFIKMLIPIPVTTMTSKTAKAMLPPSNHPSSQPWPLQKKIKVNLQGGNKLK